MKPTLSERYRSSPLMSATSTVPVAQAVVTVDAQHHGTVDAHGDIQWTDVPTVALTIGVTAPHCDPASRMIDARMASLLAKWR